MPYTEGGITISDQTEEITVYLQDVLEKLERGEAHMILADPFYRRANDKPPLSDDDVDRIITAIDSEYEEELGKYPQYHRNRSGANALPEFSRLSPTARRAVCEGLDAITQRYQPEP